ncbi:MAG: hypothetical protein Q9160_002309, partial [Pyrenula sp. 1 TL-2023]
VNEQDLELYRHASVFERVISLYGIATTKDAMRERILELLFYAIEIGGSQILATRAGILTWLKVHGMMKGPNREVVAQLLHLVESRCDLKQLEGWKGIRVSPLASE